MERSHQRAQLQYNKFSYALEQLQRTLRPMLSAIDSLRSAGNEEDLDPMSRARMHISLAYAVNSLFCMYLRTQGVDPATHPVAEEIARVQDAFMRMRKVEAGESTEHKPKPDRDRRKHIINAKKSAARLAALVFPEEDDLLLALQGKPGRLENEREGLMASNDVQKVLNEDKIVAIEEPKRVEKEGRNVEEDETHKEVNEVDSDREIKESSNHEAEAKKGAAEDEEQSVPKTPTSGEVKKRKKSKKEKKEKQRSSKKRKKAKGDDDDGGQIEPNKEKENVKSKRRQRKGDSSSSDKREKKRRKKAKRSTSD
ncbi:nuclear nucleic acid-binding protein C1D [Gracilaria domingensis]|nr:nuclear nucleic acid-binding protein C1D [Gracilaria domingensis]